MSSEGTISFPLIGEVKVGGKTAVQVGRDIRDLLVKGYQRNPQVAALVALKEAIANLRRR